MIGFDHVGVNFVLLRAVAGVQGAKSRPHFLPAVQVDRANKYGKLDAIEALGLQVVVYFRATLIVGDVVIDDSDHGRGIRGQGLGQSLVLIFFGGFILEVLE
jgi:hypothetical protein